MRPKTTVELIIGNEALKELALLYLRELDQKYDSLGISATTNSITFHYTQPIISARTTQLIDLLEKIDK